MADTTTSALNWATVENGKVKTTTSKKSDESNNGTMGYDQFLTLLCAEMQYQDPLEPTSNTEYVAQLATFSQLEAMLGMQDTQKNEMANNLVGKYVILKVSDETTGKTSYVDGKVDYVMYQEDGSQMLSVNNKLYSIDTLDTVADSDYYEAIGYAKTISNMLAQLPDIENITTKYSGAIEQIRKVYDGMTDYQKSFVSESDLAKLKKYEQKIKDLDLSKSHTAAHHQITFTLLWNMTDFSCFPLIPFFHKVLPYRNPPRKKFFSRNPPLCKLINQIFMRNHIIIAVCLLPERNTGIIRSDRHHRDLQPAFFLHRRQSLRWIQMWSYNGIKPVLLQIPL